MLTKPQAGFTTGDLSRHSCSLATPEARLQIRVFSTPTHDDNLLLRIHTAKRITDPDKHYTGKTQDLSSRLKDHNSGKVSHTSQYMPWRMINFFAFPTREKASAFEKYLKTHSGRAFASKHF